MKRMVAVTLTLCMLLGLCAFPASAETDDRPYVELTVYSEMADYSGEQVGWFAKIIKDKFNIGLNVIAANQESGDAKFATMMASGNLGDILIFSDCNGDNFTAALELGMIYDGDKSDLATVAPYISAHYQPVLERSRGKWGGMCGLGHEIQEASLGLTGNHTGGPTLRYDLYKQVGAPELSSLDDYLSVLKEMLELYPTNEDGQTVYAISYWNDWDGNCLNSAMQYALMNGYDAYGFALWHATEDKTQSILDEDSLYISGLKWIYNANQMGLLDPDSSTRASWTPSPSCRTTASSTPIRPRSPTSTTPPTAMQPASPCRLSTSPVRATTTMPAIPTAAPSPRRLPATPRMWTGSLSSLTGPTPMRAP